jgi:molybdopterin-guanine dinucleotide biosynthesis protein A
MAVPEQFDMEPVTIKSSPVAPIPGEDPLTKDQWRTLMAIADTVVPTVVEKSKGKTAFKALAVDSVDYSRALTTIEKHASHSQRRDIASEYLKERPSQLPAFREAVHRFLALNTPHDLLKLMQTGLNLLQ